MSAPSLAALADRGLLARVAGRAEQRGARSEPLGLLVLGALPLVVSLVLLDDDLFDRIVLFAAVTVFVVATVLACAGRIGGALGWMLPALLAGAEFLVVIRSTAILAPEAMPAAYGFCAVVSYHLYDTVNRARHLGSSPPGWVFVAGGGHDGRLLAVAVLAVAGSAAFATGLWVLAAALAVLYLAESVTAWVGWARRSRGSVVPLDDAASLDREELT